MQPTSIGAVAVLVATAAWVALVASARAHPLPQESGKVDLANPAHVNVQINGAAPGDQAGVSVFGAGDVNDAGLVIGAGGDIDNDGYDDVVVATPLARGNIQGAAWVVRGKSTYGSVNLADFGRQGNQEGFRINGTADYDLAGFSAAIVPDMTDDHMAEIVIGVPGTSFNGRDNSGSAYLVFGRRGDYSTLDLSQIGGDSGPGIRIDGAVPGTPGPNEEGWVIDGAGTSVSAVPNMNEFDRPEPEIALTAVRSAAEDLRLLAHQGGRRAVPRDPLLPLDRQKARPAPG